MKYWRTTELAALRQNADRPRRLLVAVLGRTQRAITAQAERQGVTLTGDLAGRWPAGTVERARRLRRQGKSLSHIAEATGVPMGTLRHWIYYGVRA
jgi:hypothetical protein